MFRETGTEDLERRRKSEYRRERRQAQAERKFGRSTAHPQPCSNGGDTDSEGGKEGDERRFWRVTGEERVRMVPLFFSLSVCRFPDFAETGGRKRWFLLPLASEPTHCLRCAVLPGLDRRFFHALGNLPARRPLGAPA